MKIGVRMYNVGFGDCFLITMQPAEPSAPFRMLIDCGRHSGSRPPDLAAGETPFEGIVDQLIADVTDDEGVARIDVVVATHRHRDHVHGFRYSEKWKKVEVRQVWLPWVEDPQNPFAKRLAAKQENLAVRAYHALRALGDAEPDSGTAREAIEIAYNSTSNATAMATLREGGFATDPKVQFLPRLGREPDRLTSEELGDVLPDGLVVHVLGPSRDPEVITQLDPPSGRAYEPLMPTHRELGDDNERNADVGAAPLPFDESWRVGEDLYGFEDGENDHIEDLVESAMLEPLELVYRVDNAINGTSLVLLLEIGETKLLFPGDAQWGTWRTMLENAATKKLLTGTTIYKVGHHGSHNATPIEFVEQCLQRGRTKAALISVAPTNYTGGWQHIPLHTLVAALEKQTEVVRTNDAAAATDDSGGSRSGEPQAARAAKPYYDLEIEAG